MSMWGNRNSHCGEAYVCPSFVGRKDRERDPLMLVVDMTAVPRGQMESVCMAGSRTGAYGAGDQRISQQIDEDVSSSSLRASILLPRANLFGMSV